MTKQLIKGASGDWELVIGLEIHVRLDTRSKLFSSARSAYGADANTQVSFVDAALPGTLPVLNQTAVDYAIRFGLSIDAEIASVTTFARKNYFYPDLPKGYQISQMDQPVVGRGSVMIINEAGEQQSVQILRAHLEEDAGKSIHDLYDSYSAIDLNRAGTPLVEVVSEPDMFSAKQAVAYMRQIYSRVTHLGICDGNLQEGSFRCDANVSVRRVGVETLGTRTEIKNLNSFRFIEKAINYEARRQVDLLESGQKVIQETRLYNPDKDQTRSMRSKEDANDYRYFPDPDLLPVPISQEQIERQRALLPELPEQKIKRYQQQHDMRVDEADIITADRYMSTFFDDMLKHAKAPGDLLAKFLLGEFSAQMNQVGGDFEQPPVSSIQLATLIDLLHDGAISRKIARQVLELMWQTDLMPDVIVAEKGLGQISDTSALESMVDGVLEANPQQVTDYRNGNDKLFNFFVGQLMKQTKGQADPNQLKTILQEKLKS
ncbi:Asp-tRNA(Asn)/Glu-tRNA(Gln) amidotransferase subunit GatB [Marinicella sp. W31]|uniref:Asp-tRNA(Asn)/Glu-tRNA(Gln) amidotransferase subunit GatB n=1 Tax=Marinicella sp. W31 TaxID=3023713 RepID=UPI003757A780